MKIAAAISLLTLGAAAPGTAQSDLIVDWGVVSDYVFRGVSHSNQKAAVQASLSYRARNGFYAGFQESTVQLSESPGWLGEASDQGWDKIDFELQAYVGYRRALARDWGLDARLGRTFFHRYLIDTPGNDYSELSLGLSFRDRIAGGVAYSNDVFDTETDGLYYFLSGELPLGRGLAIEVGTGYYDLEDAFGEGYLNWRLAVSKSFGPYQLSLGYHDTDGGGRKIFGDLADSRVVLSLSRAIRLVEVGGER